MKETRGLSRNRFKAAAVKKIDDFLGLERHLCFVNQSQSLFYKKGCSN